ncbi:hypothetical protein AQUCO_08300076v1 [Aquilegia coerulea]|uniref:Exonuclease domain-containing protein n=1 Tax=Aquilegia coerulea TaxID=218851 RepID=A0A2G5C791_AQUCA|nr:hypothetical protein AQUCO_08300076v1 [Aquilegia coerulea]
MDESILTSTEKDVLVAAVKTTQKEGLKGDYGGWKEFLAVHDKKMGYSISDPAKRSTDDLIAFLKTFSDEEDKKFLAKMVYGLSKRRSVTQSTSTEVESPEQSLVRLTLEHPDYLLNYSLPSENEEWVVTTIGKKSKSVNSNSMVAIDCEMVLCEDNTEAVVQVCVVDKNMEVKLNELVNPNKAVADYRAEITGISAKDLEGVTYSLANIQKKLKKLLRHGTILVGHSLNNDLRALKLDHARVIDTSFIFNTPTRRKPSLNNLCKTVLGYEVRKDGAPHDCLNDARAAMKLVLAKLERGIDSKIAWAAKDVLESGPAKLLLHAIPRSVPQKELHKIFPNFTFELQPRLNVRKQQQKYSVDAVFKDPEEAHEAFESIKRKEELDSFGLPQKLVLFEFSTGLPATLYVRKMPPDGSRDNPNSLMKPTVEEVKDGGVLQQCTSNKRSADVEDRDECKKPKIDSSECENPLEEIKRLKKELRQREDEVANLQKIVAALTRKQGL